MSTRRPCWGPVVLNYELIVQAQRTTNNSVLNQFIESATEIIYNTLLDSNVFDVRQSFESKCCMLNEKNLLRSLNDHHLFTNALMEIDSQCCINY